MKRIAVFASGSGTNAENLIQYFRTKPGARVELVLSNRPGAGVLERAEKLGVETIVFNRDTFYGTREIPDLLHGKGMYGENVHRAVIDNGETESGITIHRVNREYDRGDIIFQARCPVKENDTPATLASRIHELEYLHFPAVVEKLLDQL